MERFIANLVKDFESGKLSRRQFCETVALAATVYAAGDAAKAALKEKPELAEKIGQAVMAKVNVTGGATITGDADAKG